mmetsp:Transcript_13869/g.33599  ORF Transcript_13869/g.33599 Transcript_13869/m.33599 type:complete len:200 (+) Transcript_13869:87-686(+)
MVRIVVFPPSYGTRAGLSDTVCIRRIIVVFGSAKLDFVRRWRRPCIVRVGLPPLDAFGRPSILLLRPLHRTFLRTVLRRCRRTVTSIVDRCVILCIIVDGGIIVDIVIIALVTNVFAIVIRMLLPFSPFLQLGQYGKERFIRQRRRSRHYGRCRSPAERRVAHGSRTTAVRHPPRRTERQRRSHWRCGHDPSRGRTRER